MCVHRWICHFVNHYKYFIASDNASKIAPYKGAIFVCKTTNLQVEVIKYVIINSIYTHKVYTHKTISWLTSSLWFIVNKHNDAYNLKLDTTQVNKWSFIPACC